MKARLHGKRPRPRLLFFFDFEVDTLSIAVDLGFDHEEPVTGVELTLREMPGWLADGCDYVFRDRRQGHEKPAFRRRT